MPALVLVHAFPLDGSLFDAQARTLRDVAAPMLFPSLPGFGGTPVRASQPSLDDYADGVAAAMDAAGIGRAVVGGMSMGGYVALALWRRHRARVAGLLLAATRAEADTERARADRLRLAGIVRRHGTEALLKTPPQWLRAGSPRWPDALAIIRRQPAEAVAQAQVAMAGRPDSRAHLAGIDVPALVVVGEHDAITPLPMSRAMQDGIAGSTLSLVPDAGHLANLDAPAAFDTAVRLWMRRL